jgi:ribonuclease HII
MGDDVTVIAGVDEAGRGPVLGPLVVAAVEGTRAAFADLGVDDSKELAADERERLDEAVRATARGVALEVLEPRTVDEAVRGPGLDTLELEAFADACRRLEAETVSADACGPDAEAFRRDLARQLPDATAVEAAHGADASDPAVAAASIVAKVRRDEAVAELADVLGADVGSGYPSDPATRAFLEDWVEAEGELPPGTRASWSTARELVPPEKTLDAFAEGSP